MSSGGSGEDEQPCAKARSGRPHLRGRTPMRLTLDQIRMYEAFDGDIDGWTRSRHAAENPASGENWDVIDGLLMALTIQAGGVASERLVADLDAALAVAAPDQKVRRELLALAGRVLARRTDIKAGGWP